MDTLQCSYCSLDIIDDGYLHCGNCGGDVHIKCLKLCSTPGDLLGDVFFDFTCAKCTQIQTDDPHSTSSNLLLKPDINDDSNGKREKFIRQRMPWLLIIAIALYNLSIKSNGLSRHGFFHWKTHIVNFIEKNWNFLFDPSIKRRKKWIGSISGALSHNSPKYFTSGQELFDEAGWWKLTHCNKTPKYIFNLYEQECLQRQKIRIDKRQLQDCGSDTSNNDHVNKRICVDSDDDQICTDSCSRTIPYMGRKPKIFNKVQNVLNELDNNQPNQPTVPIEDTLMPLNTVQSSLMDFLAENLASDDLNMFNTLPNIAQEPLVETTGKNDILPLLDIHNENANLFGNSSIIKTEPMDLNGQLNNFYANAATFSSEQQQQQQQNVINANIQNPDMDNNLAYYADENQTGTNSIQTNSEFSNEHDDESTRTSSNLKSSIHEDEFSSETEEEDSDSAEEFKPRIVQVTYFQPLTNPIKDEINSDTEHSRNIKSEINKSENEEEISDIDEDTDANLKLCKPSLFTRRPKRQWPWLVDNGKDDMEDETETKTENNPNAKLTMMSEYEEKELLQKLRKIFKFKEKCKIEIPTFIRIYYRKLCIREWKREHGKKIFNLDDYIGDRKLHMRTEFDEKPNLIDRYQLTVSSSNVKKSFYARISGSSEYELFQSPYTQRVLCPFIRQDRKCIPPFLKLMCELQYKVRKEVVSRAPIDYCYIRPNHVAAVNALLQTEFWPGIDMSDCLSYPDFTVVALYKKLVIGCGFLIPDVGFNVAYISYMAVRPGWQRCGIGTFMLYHLIQTCMSKDITLHVSASNPALVLYQKFGFKIEELIQNFYEKYIPFDSKQSRHAFFLRLMR